MGNKTADKSNSAKADEVKAGADKNTDKDLNAGADANAGTDANAGADASANSGDAASAGKDTEKNTGKKNKAVEMLRIRALGKDGFRRGGMKFTQEAFEIAVADLSEEQLAAIHDEPRLSVEAFTL